MSLIEKIMEKHEKKVQDARANMDRAERELSEASGNYDLAKRVVRNVKIMGKMSDSKVRKINLPRILVSTHYDLVFIKYAQEKAGPKYIVDVDISQRFDALRHWLVEKHDSVYDVEFRGTFGSMSARNLKEGHNESEFNNKVWSKLDEWAKLYSGREMAEDLYTSIMRDDFEILYSQLCK
ncbi:MAG: hypothetical protein Q8P57_03740 [Candidatus Pacearchaeota archaeon]|nr:hypothetical protein [Candidatus Pacearchaeota archaeon]